MRTEHLLRLARAACAVGVLALPPDVRAQDREAEPRSATTTVFARYASRILKIQVVEVASAAKVATGTGFFVAADGTMMTNYHVISDWIHEPENYRIEVLDDAGDPTVASVLTVDVIADLAILATGKPVPQHFTLGPAELLQGDRLYSLGHPGDLGLSIVEGTYNGLLRHTLYPKIHFTGSINPGMSGGPTITSAGRVVGVNVSTMGNQRSFLVPQDRASALLAKAQAAGFTPPERFLDLVAEQVRAFQEAYLSTMFDGEVPNVEVGRFRVVTEPTDIFRCWGDADREPDRLYETLDHSCSTDDYVYIADRQGSGVIRFRHQVIRSTGLSARRFTNYFQSVFQRDHTPGGSEKHVAPWECTSRNVRVAETTMRAVYCLRKLRKLGELYDAVVKVAVLGDAQTGLISTLTLSGVSAANAERLSTRYLELVSWR
ncbi:MAG: serine protease [Gemmatimonadaceae bacterium]